MPKGRQRFPLAAFFVSKTNNRKEVPKKMSIQTNYQNGQSSQFIVKEVLRTYQDLEELSRVLLMAQDLKIEITTAFYSGSLLYVFLKVTLDIREAWVADVELGHPGLDDEKADEAFADAILDEAEYWASVNSGRIASDYQDFDYMISLVEKDEQ
jgi:hypothetical protein